MKKIDIIGRALVGIMIIFALWGIIVMATDKSADDPIERRRRIERGYCPDCGWPIAVLLGDKYVSCNWCGDRENPELIKEIKEAQERNRLNRKRP